MKIQVQRHSRRHSSVVWKHPLKQRLNLQFSLVLSGIVVFGYTICKQIVIKYYFKNLLLLNNLQFETKMSQKSVTKLNSASVAVPYQRSTAES